VPDIPLQARSGREAFPERWDSKAEADHVLWIVALGAAGCRDSTETDCQSPRQWYPTTRHNSHRSHRCQPRHLFANSASTRWLHKKRKGCHVCRVPSSQFRADSGGPSESPPVPGMQ
jgi:hypothetical protein